MSKKESTTMYRVSRGMLICLGVSSVGVMAFSILYGLHVAIPFVSFWVLLATVGLAIGLRESNPKEFGRRKRKPKKVVAVEKNEQKSEYVRSFAEAQKRFEQEKRNCLTSGTYSSYKKTRTSPTSNILNSIGTVFEVSLLVFLEFPRTMCFIVVACFFFATADLSPSPKDSNSEYINHSSDSWSEEWAEDMYQSSEFQNASHAVQEDAFIYNYLRGMGYSDAEATDAVIDTMHLSEYD